MLSYRSDIDGLRAFAVLAVLFYHAEFDYYGIPPLPGGFFGVDIFFVISGYLISSNVLNDLRKGCFSFHGFYERRARRLLPVLILILVVSFILAWKYLTPLLILDYSATALSSLFLATNFWFWNEGSNYWAPTGLLRPLLHIWSLSLEEQFYLIWPLVMVACWRFVKNPIITFSLLVIGALISFSVAHLYVLGSSDFLFYLLPARAWEFIAGAFLAYLEINYGRHRHPILSKVAPLTGLCCVLLSFSIKVEYLSVFTLLPVVGTMLIIWFSKSRNFVYEVLSTKPIVLIGLISYSLYMWHYVIYSFSRINYSFHSNNDKCAVLILTFIVASISYIVIERPFRNFNIVSSKIFKKVIGISFFLILVLNLSTFVTGGLLNRFDQDKMELFETIGSYSVSKADSRHPGQYVITNYNKNARDREFYETSKKNIFLYGDSFSQDFYNILYEGGYLKGYEVSATKIGRECNVPLFVNLKKIMGEKEFISNKCDRAKRIGDPTIQSKLLSADVVILASAWTDYSYKYINKTIDYMKGIGVKDILVVGSKRFPEIRNHLIVSKSLNELRKDVFIISDVDQVFHRFISIRKMGIENFIDLQLLACGSDDTCPLLTPNYKFISYDGRHLSRAGVLYFTELLKDNEVMKRYFN